MHYHFDGKLPVLDPADPSKISTFRIDESVISYELVTSRKQEYVLYNYLIALLNRGILNVCELVVDNGSLSSVAQNLSQIREKLEFTEILAEIVLYQILFGCNDRGLRTYSTHRGDQEIIVGPHNCRIGSEGTYSIFDVEGCILSGDSFDIEYGIYSNVVDLIADDFVSLNTLADFYALMVPGKNNFNDRFILKVQEFLELFDSESGKKHFTALGTKAYNDLSQVDRLKDNLCIEEWSRLLDEKYYFFLKFLKKIQDHFANNYDTLFTGEKFGRRVFQSEMRYHISMIVEGVKNRFSVLMKI